MASASKDVGTRARQLQTDAELLLKKMRTGARRAYVVELTGTPKSGKTTTLAMLQHFFKASGFKVHTLRERAADCPLPMKGHFFFNAWTTCTMLAEVLATYDTSQDILILDRGFFDALIWLELQRARYQVSGQEEETFSEFVLLDRWRSLVDLTLVITVSPEVALVREDKNQLLQRRGSMMNPKALREFNRAVRRATGKYAPKFPLLAMDTSRSTRPQDSVLSIIEQLLPRIETWADPRILVVPRESVQRLFARASFLDAKRARPAMEQLIQSARGMSRYEAEHSDDVVQLVAAGIPIRVGHGIFVFRRNPADEKVSHYGQALVWKGRHVENGRKLSLRRAADQLKNRLREELHLELDLKPEFLGLAWNRDGRDPKHLGIMFRVPLSESVAETLEAKEFRKSGRGHTLVGRFLAQREIVRTAASLDLEPWSNHIVRNIEVAR